MLKRCLGSLLSRCVVPWEVIMAGALIGLDHPMYLEKGFYGLYLVVALFEGSGVVLGAWRI